MDTLPCTGSPMPSEASAIQWGPAGCATAALASKGSSEEGKRYSGCGTCQEAVVTADAFAPVIADDAVSTHFDGASNDVAEAVAHSVGAVDPDMDGGHLVSV